LKTAWYGLRDVDVAERSRLAGHAVTMPDVDRYGVETTVRRLVDWLTSTGAKRLWISFDVDALDPILAPGTGTAVRGGLSYREGHLLAELLHEFLADAGVQIVGVDLVETNPLADRGNETAIMGVEWIASLLGKTVLGNGVQ
jgi:arginase